MLNFILRRTVYKNLTPEEQNFMLQTHSKYYSSSLICIVILFFLATAPFNILLILFSCDEDISIKAQIILSIFLIIYILLIVSFKNEFVQLACLMLKKIYFSLYTKSGKALSKKDFKIIQKNDKELYYAMSTLICSGRCYAVCFSLLKVLQTGTMKFIAVKYLSVDKEEVKSDRAYTMHVLYVNNGWAYDTYSQRQFPLEKIIDIFKCKYYKEFNFKDIYNMSYKDFRDLHSKELKNWCDTNDVYQEWTNH